ncbi:MAG: ThiF family adenylyltransferase [bacterium]|nr:ThiF family adenylyltransferase [bacterium]
MQDTSRYSRQIRFAPIGEAGQTKISQASVLICGCGALGSLIAERLARAGVGRLRLVDRDWVEYSNLQRQALFTEADAASATPKAVAAAAALARINSEIALEPYVEDVHAGNIRRLSEGCEVVLDGTDNFETRFLINDYCLSSNTPWIHAGCLGASGQILSILPGTTACFRCLIPDLPPREAMETCDSAGVLGPTIGIIASWQASEALKVISGNLPAVCRGLIVLDSWNNDCRIVQLPRNPQCPACVHEDYPFLEGRIRTSTTVLCGKNAVQIDSPGIQHESLDVLAQKLSPLGEVTRNAYFVRLALAQHTLTIFRGGRTVVQGTTSEAEAKSLLAQTLGG